MWENSCKQKDAMYQWTYQKTRVDTLIKSWYINTNQPKNTSWYTIIKPRTYHNTKTFSLKLLSIQGSQRLFFLRSVNGRGSLGTSPLEMVKSIFKEIYPSCTLPTHRKIYGYTKSIWWWCGKGSPCFSICFVETSIPLSTLLTSKCTGSGLSTFYIRFAASVVIQILQTVRPFKLWHWSPCASRLTIIGLILYELVNAWPEFIECWNTKKKQNDMEQANTLRRTTNITPNTSRNRSRATRKNSMSKLNGLTPSRAMARFLKPP